MVKEVGGNHVGVVCLTSTTGPHGYNYNAQDAMTVRDADLFFAIGLGLDDSFTDKARVNSGNRKLQEVVKLGDRLPAGLVEEMKGHAHDHKHDHGHAHKHDHKHDHGQAKGEAHDHGKDPHVWLGIPQTVNLVEQIRDRLKEADAPHAGDYDKNAAAFIERLKKLQAEGKAALAKKKDRRLISFHESLEYFADSFGLEVVASVQRTPGENPDPKTLQDLIALIEKDKVKVLAVEPQYESDKAVQAITGELKKQNAELTILVIDPLETAQEKELDAGWYERKMRENLDTLEKNLP
jgi:zinc transport system substrate-binding protein